VKKIVDPRFIEKLKEAAGSSSVLTDLEDLFVYSFTGPLGLKRGQQPIAVVRLHFKAEVKGIIELCNREGIKVVRRGEADERAGEGSPVVIIDHLIPPDANSLRENLERTKEAHVKRIRSLEQSTPMSWLSVYEPMLSERLLYRCKMCPRYSGTACSGYCTMSPFYEGIETWSSKGRLLLIKGLLNGELEPTEKLVDSIYTCTTCSACYAQCVGEGPEITRAIEFARNEIAEKGLAPKVFSSLIECVVKEGRPYKLITPIGRARWLKELPGLSLTKEAEVLYWVGCTSSYLCSNIAKSTVNILRKGGVNFTILGDDEGCCGLPLMHIGARREAMKIAAENIEKLRKTGASTLMVGCSGCYYAFKRVYPELLGVRVPMEVLHISHVIERLVKSGSLKLNPLDMRVTWHDPCTLGRHCGVYEPPRSILRSIPGLKFSEMALNREYGRCCGAGGGFSAFNHEIAVKIAESYLLENAAPLKVEAIVTACPNCYTSFRHAARSLRRTTNDFRMDVYDLSEIVEKALRLH
jgi:Fe-S oxidoreductase